MSEARRRRRAMEKALGLKKPKNFFSKEASELRARKIKAGEEVHRQNLEKMANARRLKEEEKNSNAIEETDGISLNASDVDETSITLENNPYGFLDNNEDSEGISLGN